MKKVFFIFVLCLAVPASAMAAKFDTYSSVKQVTGTITIITTNGTNLQKAAVLTKGEKAGEYGYTTQATDSNGNQVANMKTFNDRLFFSDATVEVQGDLLSLRKSLIGSARFRVLTPPTAGTTTNGMEITGAANVQIVQNAKGTSAVVKMTFLPDNVFQVYSSGSATPDFKAPIGTAVVKLPAVKKIVLANQSTVALPFPIITSAN